jgi:pyridoxal phosphate enzyme (YggS family)
MSVEIAHNLETIRQRVAAACQRCGRDPHDVQLIAVSKKKPATLIEEALNAGQTLFGESYVQEFIDKQQSINGTPRWHFIGALQTNKVKYLTGKTELIHSVDRLSLASEINKHWGKSGAVARILVQVNVGDETSKAGVPVDEAVELVQQLATLPHIRIEGLMALPPYAEDLEQVRPWFRLLRELAEKIDSLNLPNVSMATLSMGMSHDFEIAIEEGATLIRVGTAIFGARE